MARRLLQPSPVNHDASSAPNPMPTAEALASHMPLVHKVVAHFVRRLPSSVQREDLVAAGTLGLFYALRASTHTCEEMFASYARIRIRGAIVDELRRHDWSPRRRRSVAPPMGAANDTVPPSGPGPVANLAVAIGSRPADASATGAVIRLFPTRAPPAPTPPRFAVVGFDDLPPHQMHAVLGDGESQVSPLAEVEGKRTSAALHAAVDLLPEREKDIIRMRYFEAMPSKAIASALGLSEARISQLHSRATARLRDLLAADGRGMELAA